VFLYTLVLSQSFKRPPALSNPWGSRSIEFHLPSPVPVHNFDQIPPELRANILAFYSDPSAPIATKKKPEAWQKTAGEVEKLRALPDSTPGSKAISDVPPKSGEPAQVFK
jgi:heme/copper-type cytochrome/quinol oxidase subunit 1